MDYINSLVLLILFIGPCFSLHKKKINYAYVALFTILISIPNIFDFFLTLLGISNGSKAFFIIRFISQALNILHNLSLLALLFKNRRTGDINIYSYYLYSSIMLAIEITSFVFFIKLSNTINTIAKIGYYIHFVYILVHFLLVFPLIKIKKNN